MSKEEFMYKGNFFTRMLCRVGFHLKWGSIYTTFLNGEIQIPYQRFCRYCGHEEDNPLMER